MRRFLPELSKSAWKRVIEVTVFMVVLINFVAIGGRALGAQLLTGHFTAADVIVASALATLLTGPIIGVLNIKIQQLRAANDKLEFYATTDGLTGVLNRAAFTSRLEHHLASDNTVSCLLVVDVDKFKQVNDRFGHAKGDVALRAIAQVMRTQLRTQDMIGRLGGEEFGIFLPDCPTGQGLVIGERVRAAVHDIHFAPDGAHYPLSVSIGIATNSDARDFEALYKQADILLCAAKRNGRDRIESAADNVPETKVAKAEAAQA